MKNQCRVVVMFIYFLFCPSSAVDPISLGCVPVESKG